ncbi:MAG TPA: CdaR family protein [Candidatus Baltobacteraceae bacterium]|nr:CdaR family protein [Candidatus Baltobacteraceae bacterium]
MPDFITKDFGWKLASVVLAVVIWVIVFKYNGGAFEHVTSTVENTYGDLQVAVVSKTGDPRAYQIAPLKVSVKVSGPDSVMNALQGNQVQPFIDVTDKASAGSFRATVNVSLPKGVTLVDVDPSWVGVVAPGH